MLETLYKDPATIERYRLVPLLEDRERYLCAVLASGAVVEVARRVARAQLALIDLLNLPDADIPVDFAAVETAVQAWCRNVPAVSAANFRRHAFRWLRFLAGWKSRLGMPIRTPGRWRLLPPGRGTTGGCPKRPSATAATRATVSLPGVAARNLMLADMTIGDVDEFLSIPPLLRFYWQYD